MKNLLLLIIPLFSIQTAPGQIRPDSIQAESFAGAICRHMEVLASDSFEGRKPGTAGESRTIDYITRQFEEIGLKGAAEDGSYLQKVELAEFTTLAPGALDLIKDTSTIRWSHGRQFLLASKTTRETVRIPLSPLVFAGFGIHAPEIGWDDYRDTDVAGKIVVVLSDSPDQYTEDSTLWKGDPAANLYGQSFYKKNEAARRGALGLIIIYREKPHSFYNWEYLQRIYGQKSMAIRKSPKDVQLSFEGLITREAADELFTLAGLPGMDYRKKALEPGFRAMDLGVRTSFAFSNTWKELDTYNVAGILPGTDRADEVIIYSAHWDHVGIGTPVNGDSIRNGAVDNASGTAGLIELARAWKSLPSPPRRSILFLATGAEEMGLLGAVWYASHPIFPIGKTVAALNMDSHFPYGKTRYVTGVVYGRSDLDGYLEESARRQDRVIIPNTEQNISQNIFFRSDHFPFAEAGIPSEFAVGFGGVDSLRWAEKAGAYMPKYHQPTDEVEPDHDCSGIWQDAELIFLTGQFLDREAAFPQWDTDQPFARLRQKARFESRFYLDVSNTHLPITSLLGRSMDAATADLDGDGDLDIVVANEHLPNILLINDGTGRFTDETAARLPMKNRDSEEVVISDFDGDGDPDLVFVSEDDQVNEYYENDGKGFFRDISHRIPVSGTSNAALALDINRDGYPDLLIGNAPDRNGIGGQNVCLINDGTGHFTDETRDRFPQSHRATQDLESGDIDGDGDIDLILANEDGNEIWINDGNGFFKDESQLRLPAGLPRMESRQASLADVDGDGDPDLFFANVNFRGDLDNRNCLLLNDGRGYFTLASSGLGVDTWHTLDGTWGDPDRDGDPDLITSNGFGGSYKVYINDGPGFFIGDPGTFLPASVRGDGLDAEIADFNGDSVPDLFLCNFRGQDFLLFGKKAPDGLDAQEILLRHNRAMGGLDAWRQVRSWRIRHRRPNGTVTGTAVLPDKYRLEFRTSGRHLVKSWDGKEGWLRDNGKKEPMRPGEAIEMAEEPHYYGELLFAQMRGLPIDLLGETTLDGRRHYYLRLTKNPADEQFYWIDAESFLISQVGEFSEDPAHAGIFYRSRMSLYRSVDGRMFPTQEALIPNDGPSRGWENEVIEINPEVRSSFFKK